MPGVVTVGCKLPHGLLLQLQKSEIRQEAVMGGGFKEITRYERVGGMVKIDGYAHRRDKAPTALLATPNCALTPNVDADFFSEWMKQNKEHPAVVGNFIFARGKADDAKAQGNEMIAVRSGFEPFDPDNPVSEFKRKIETKKD